MNLPFSALFIITLRRHLIGQSIWQSGRQVYSTLLGEDDAFGALAIGEVYAQTLVLGFRH